MKYNVLMFIKNRFLLAIILLIIVALISPININEGIYIIIISTIALILHSFLHELGHAIAAIFLGIKVSKFTINRVYFKDEPSSFQEIKNSNNRFKYGIIAVSGSLATILFGYILLFILHSLREGISLATFLVWLFTLIIFLLGDCWYLISSSVLMEGDSVGISAGFNISSITIFSFGIIISVINTFLIWRYFWILK